ncbi:ubiquitin carboxyl-terminal hydrolase 8 [[Emmonsia] crescens]|uniref:Ubiquitin carboxyl-terminal hydrolase 8 n=1 Tax=[Emmonsia] crescens TaxID=73230 RepID=A0A2B7Z6P0_9EURO|nr:ubiquitin carboxyl-terminal hydrolase 8 [Emmonsia crescens]
MRGQDDFSTGEPYRNNGGPCPAPQRRSHQTAEGLEDMAASMNIDEGASLNELLRISEESIQASKISLAKGLLDSAFNNHLRASEIAVNAIPNHPDYEYMKRQHQGWNDRFIKLTAAIRSQEGRMASVKYIIDQSKKSLNGHQPNSSPRGMLSRTPPVDVGYVDSSPLTVHHRSQTPNGPPLRMPSPTGFQQKRPASVTPESLTIGRPNTESRPRSEILPRKPVSSETSASDPLTQRFAELRRSRQNKSSNAFEQNGVAQSSASSASSPVERPGSRSNAMLSFNHPNTRPLGPRDMSSSQRPPAPPPKVPLNTTNTSLPRYPSPAYSPVWTVPSQPPSNPPKTSTDTARPALSRQASSFNGPPSDNLNGYSNGDSPYRSQTPNSVYSRGDAPSRSANIPLQPTIHPDRLYDYLQKYEVLLIDVRPRDRFDAGHIYSKSIICIEPVALKENVSAEELEDRLVLSPEVEQSLFSRRNEFDLIVYYDQSTREASYLIGSPAGSSLPHLRALYDTLYEFNAYKPLRDGRQPALLVGGLDAWVDLVGPHSLATSKTAAVLSSIHARRPAQAAAKPLRRVPTASANSSWEVRKRRLREFKPLNPEEERAWLEKARNEEIDPSTYVTEDGTITEEPDSFDEQEPPSPFVHDYEDFFRRFPEPRDIRQSMVGAHAQPISPQIPLSDPSLPPSLSRPTPAIPRPIYSGVSEGRHVQPPLARQSSASKTALYAASSPIDRMKLPRTGLVNMGSTCYMNSIIQCLSVTIQLTKFFIDNGFHSQVQKNWKGSQGILPGLFANLVRSLWKNDVEVIRPTSFRNFIGRLNPEWAGSRQQDAKEFFDVLLDCLHEDLNLNWNRTPLKPLTIEQEMRREQMPIEQVSTIEWNRYCHREYSYISSLFAGQHASRLRCRTCRRTSTTYEAFFSISVEIPTSPASGAGDLYQCLNSYCQEEMLSGDEVWKCPHCRRECEATKQIILTRAPRFLVIHFKRFSLSRYQQTRKIHTPINFPITGLDITPFMAPPVRTSPVPNGGADGNNQQSQPELATTPPYIYNAYGIVRHIGSSSSEGHYISLVRDDRRGCWRKFDDQRVTDFNPVGLRPADSLQNDQAYLVFYERALTN